MRTYYIYILIFFTNAIQPVKAQVGIGTLSPNSSSMLDIYSKSKGVIFPTYSLTSLTDSTNPIINPSNGLIIYNNGGTYSKGLYYWYVNSWSKLFLSSDVAHSMVLSTTANTANILTPFITSTASSPNKFSTFGLVGNSITGASFDQSNSTITLPKGKYKIEFSVDATVTAYASGQTPLNPTNQRVNYVSFNTYLRSTAGTILGEQSIDSEIFTSSFATYYTCFYIDLSDSTTFSFYIDFTSDSAKGNFRPRASADLQIYELLN